MSDPRRLSRGRVLAALAGLGLTAGLAPLRPWRALVELRPRTAAGRLAALLPDVEASRAVGEAYLARGGPERTAAALAEPLVASLGGRGTVEAAGDLRAVVETRVREDFAHGRTVVLGGWILSETEARLCALAVLVRRA